MIERKQSPYLSEVDITREEWALLEDELTFMNSDMDRDEVIDTVGHWFNRLMHDRKVKRV